MGVKNDVMLPYVKICIACRNLSHAPDTYRVLACDILSDIQGSDFNKFII